MSQTVIFLILSVIILACAFMAVTTRQVMRAATYLLFVLFGTAGLYFLMGYTFLGAVQVMVYAGGVVVLYVFALMLTGRMEAKDTTKQTWAKRTAALLACLGSAGVFLYIVIMHKFVGMALEAPCEKLTSIETIGQRLLSSDEGGYLLPFEVVSVLLLACIVAGLLLARKR